jgi:hypothetical protein
LTSACLVAVTTTAAAESEAGRLTATRPERSAASIATSGVEVVRPAGVRAAVVSASRHRPVAVTLPSLQSTSLMRPGKTTRPPYVEVAARALEPRQRAVAGAEQDVEVELVAPERPAHVDLDAADGSERGERSASNRRRTSGVTASPLFGTSIHMY